MRHLLVGLGNIGAKRKGILGDRCVGTVDPFNPAADFTDPSECPADRYEAVALAVPNPVKLELLESFLIQGKHVLVEKPLLFPDEETARRMEDLARERKVIWYTSYNHRFEPLVAALKEQLEAEALGRIYHGRLLYGNGTVQNVVGTWREEGHGVLEDLACHLIDLTGYLFGYGGGDFQVWAIQSNESKSSDRCLLATADRRFELECSMICWKNTFTIDVFGETGSIHLNGLCKWGTSELIVRQRKYPSGVPSETRKVVEGPDASWEKDLIHFEALVGSGETSCENDWWISKTILSAASAYPVA